MILASSSPPRLLKCWGNEAVVYDITSGDTHYLKPLTLAVYQTCLDHAGYTPIELVADLAMRLGVENTMELQDVVEDVLDSLQKIGLLESA